MFRGVIRNLESKDFPQVESIFDLYWSGEFRAHLSDRLRSPDFAWIVAQEDREVVGVASSRNAPERMRAYATTERVIEFYVAAAKCKGTGIGTALRNALIERARKDDYQEAVFFSGNTHENSWAFHDNSEFKRAGDAVAPDGEHGKIWVMKL